MVAMSSKEEVLATRANETASYVVEGLLPTLVGVLVLLQPKPPSRMSRLPVSHFKEEREALGQKPK